VTPDSPKSLETSVAPQARPAHPPGALARYGAVAFAGVVGGLLRFGQQSLLNGPSGTFPWGTFTINVAGSIALGAFLSVLLETAGTHPLWRPFFAIGFCGTYTTWSSFESETLGLFRREAPLLAATYVVASLIVGLGAAFASFRLARRVRAGRGRLLLAPPLLLAPLLALLVTAGIVAARGRLHPVEVERLALSCLAIVVGGIPGGAARYSIGALAGARLGAFFPWGTLFINVTGSFLIGAFDGATQGRTGLSRYLRDRR
jgi:CrcB protein